MKIGMTGSRVGMSERAEEVFRKTLEEGEYNSLSHGDCIGADADAHRIAGECGLVRHIHPPSNDSLRAYCAAARIYPEKGYFARNRDIVDTTDILYGFPARTTQRGGTWYTINYAKDKGLPVTIIWSDGSVDCFNQ